MVRASSSRSTARAWHAQRLRPELLEQEADDRHLAAGAFPRVADAVVVDEPGGVGRAAEGGGGRLGERGRLDLVAVGGERLEALPQRLERAPLLAQRERARI